MRGEADPQAEQPSAPKASARQSLWRRLWFPLALLLIGGYVFWVLPMQLGNPPVRVEFESVSP